MTGQFYIQTKNTVDILDVSVYDGNGRLQIYQSHGTVNLSRLTAGVYCVQFKTDAGTIYEKVSKL